LPKRTKLLKATAEPKLAISSTENDEPSLATPNNESEDPNRAILLSESEDPRLEKSNTDTA
jgi:hypothetical protein